MTTTVGATMLVNDVSMRRKDAGTSEFRGGNLLCPNSDPLRFVLVRRAPLTYAFSARVSRYVFAGVVCFRFGGCLCTTFRSG